MIYKFYISHDQIVTIESPVDLNLSVDQLIDIVDIEDNVNSPRILHRIGVIKLKIHLEGKDYGKFVTHVHFD
jgi:hypothetical protein